jgi:alpha-L-fucosidase
VKTPQQLLDIYFQSVGRGACLNLNVPPDRRGRINDADIKSLREFRRLVDATFAKNLATVGKISASNIRGNDAGFTAANVLDGNRETYWCTDNDVHTPELVIEFNAPTTFDILSLREYLPLGQRIDAFAIDAWTDGKWNECATGTSIGNHRLVRLRSKLKATKIRVRVTGAKACPAISEIGVFDSAR